MAFGGFGGFRLANSPSALVPARHLYGWAHRFRLGGHRFVLVFRFMLDLGGLCLAPSPSAVVSAPQIEIM